ncbi:MAG: dienelactone hydrolase family protein [Anaerolineae bacterium]|uniref:alpha/beta hydrolase n=1 Tax=Promineifilum sp. TaxID=2664178 RepID=UPI001DA3BB0B|nr:dienelactone hydrolase family protein [Anaerolineales bacterium]MCB8936656.1 dienelactone hydrolase family protein [Promineifilum sp.]MCO5181208.1 dienelactone hydrolase family protein [Promineifilum sp.]MCW5847986.1 dienelactone hydrolase family protein [Anaerolineae bacterium]
MSTHAKPHENGPLLAAGPALEHATGALLLLHGRGATAESILELAPYLSHPDLAFLAPQADDFTWYPYSFLSPTERNEPYLSAALARVAAVVARAEAAGIPPERLIVGGFSQGACLAAEFVARHARRYGGLIVLSGGLIGPPGTPRGYAGSLAATPVFIGCSDRDPHIPVERVRETAEVLARLGGQVDSRIYPGLGHTINQDEIDAAASLVAAAMDG